jgi:hypothetical protein
MIATCWDGRDGNDSTEGMMVSQRVNDVATTAYGLWLREDATLEDMRVGFDCMCPGPRPMQRSPRPTSGVCPASG